MLLWILAIATLAISIVYNIIMRKIWILDYIFPNIALRSVSPEFGDIGVALRLFPIRGYIGWSVNPPQYVAGIYINHQTFYIKIHNRWFIVDYSPHYTTLYRPFASEDLLKRTADYVHKACKKTKRSMFQVSPKNPDRWCRVGSLPDAELEYATSDIINQIVDIIQHGYDRFIIYGMSVYTRDAIVNAVSAKLHYNIGIINSCQEAERNIIWNSISEDMPVKFISVIHEFDKIASDIKRNASEITVMQLYNIMHGLNRWRSVVFITGEEHWWEYYQFEMLTKKPIHVVHLGPVKCRISTATGNSRLRTDVI